jgi:uncharacterized protein (DUF433 family)
MKIEDYLDLSDPDGPRFVGHRIWLFDLLYEVVFNRAAAEQLLERFPSLNMEQIYFALAYFEKNRWPLTRDLLEELDRREKLHAAHAADGRALYTDLLRRMTAIQTAAK